MAQTQIIGTIKERSEPTVSNTNPLLTGLTADEGDDIFSTPFYDGATRSVEQANKSSFPDPVKTDDDGFNFTEVAPVLAAGMSSVGNTPPTTSSFEAGTHAVKSGATGAVAGALAGAKLGSITGPQGAVIGGILGLAFGGVDAYFKVKNSRKQARAARRMQKAAREANEKALAEARKWQKINRMDTLEQARRDLAKQKAQNRWTNYNNVKGRMTNILNSNQDLASNFRKMLRSA